MSTIIRKIKLTRITAALLIMAFVGACFSPITAIKARAAGTGFPLPVTGTAYQVSVLNKYSGGGEHSSYINQYVLGIGSAPRDIVMDIAATGGTKVYAVASGKVITAKYFSAGGNALVIQHSDGSYSYYGHLQSYCVNKGATVTAGQLIGYVGKTGSGATGNHLHFEWSKHDPYCTYSSKGYVKIMNNSGASKFKHSHSSQPTTTTTTASKAAPFTEMKNLTNHTATSTQVNFTVKNPSRLNLTEVGLQIKKYNANSWTSKSDNISRASYRTSTSFNAWFSIGSGKEINYSLSPNTKYYVRTFIKYSGSSSPVYGPTYYFVTKQATVSAPRVTYSDVKCTSVSWCNAKLQGHINNPYGEKFSQVGCYIWNKNGTLIKNYAESCTLSLTSFNQFLNVNTEAHLFLSPGQTYTYQFWAKTSSGTYYSAKSTFKTSW